MGIHDRDYYRQSLPRGGFGHFEAWSVTTWLIIINVVVFFADAALFRASHAGRARNPYEYAYDEGDEEVMLDDEETAATTQPSTTQASATQPSPHRPSARNIEAMMLQMMGPLQRWGYFSTAKAIYAGQIWRFVTFQFLHAWPFHLIANMLGLYFFGPIVEAQFGSRRFLAFYLLCGFAGAVCYLLLSLTNVLIVDAAMPMVGASAGVFGLLVAAAVISPHVEVFYYLFPVTIRTLAVFGMLMALYSVISLGYNSGGEAAHLGGGILGFLLMQNQHWLNPFAAERRRATVRATSQSSSPPRRRKRRGYQKDWSKDFNR